MKSVLIKNMIDDLGEGATTDVPIPNVSSPDDPAHLCAYANIQS
jgi:hypothetical protein